MKKYAALKEQIGSLGDAERFFNVVVGDKNAYVAVLEFPHNILYVLHGNGVNTGKGFIEHNKLRVDGQTARYLGSAALTARKAVARVLAYLVKAEFLNETFEFFTLIVLGLSRHLEHGLDVVLHGHLSKHAGLLCQIAYTSLGALINGIVRYFAVVKVYVPCVGHYKPCCHIERRGLASTIRS